MEGNETSEELEDFTRNPGKEKAGKNRKKTISYCQIRFLQSNKLVQYIGKEDIG